MYRRVKRFKGRTKKVKRELGIRIELNALLYIKSMRIHFCVNPNECAWGIDSYCKAFLHQCMNNYLMLRVQNIIVYMLVSISTKNH